MVFAPHTLASGPGWRVSDVVCTAGPHDRPFEEQHDAVCIAAVSRAPSWRGKQRITDALIQMGILSPPVGLNVFIVKGIVPDVPMYTIFRGIWPFWYAMGLLIVLLLIFPQLALFLPNTMFGK